MKRKKTILHIIPLLLVAWFAANQAWGGENPAWELVDGIAATLAGDPVLRSDVQMEVDLGLLEANGGVDFHSLLEVYLNRLLILKEVEELGGYRLTRGEIEGAYRGYLGQYPDDSVYRDKLARWSIDEEEVYRRLKNALLATLYTESRLQFLVNVLPNDIEESYRNNPERWEAKGLYEAWEAIRAQLIRERFAFEKERWLATLRERYDLVVLERENP